MGMNTVQSLTVNGKRYDSFPDREAREAMDSKLPMPEGTAGAGQYLAVDAVDENGVVRSLRAVDGPQPEPYALPVAGTELGGVKNGGNVTIEADGTMNAPEFDVTDAQVSAAVSDWLEAHPESTAGAQPDSAYVGNIGEKFYKRMDFCWSTNKSPRREGTCRLYKAKAGDMFYIPRIPFTNDASYNSIYDKIWLIDRDTTTITELAVIEPVWVNRFFLFTAEQDCYVLVNEQTPNGTRSLFNIYRNAFVDASYIPELYGAETLLSLTEGMMKGLKGIVTTCNSNIHYEPGYYIAYTNGHETINFPNIVMIHGDVVYFDGECFHHCKELTKRNTIAKKNHYNVVIIGSGASGISTALNLIGTGARVALIEKNHHLGGTHTCAGAIDLCPSPADDSLKQVVLDAWEDGFGGFSSVGYELGTTQRSDKFDLWWNGSHLNWVNGDGAVTHSAMGNRVILDPHYMQQYYYQKLTQGGVDVFLDTEIADVMYEGSYIRAVTTTDGTVFNGDFFVDAGDNIIMRRAGEMGVDYFLGFDGGERFGEAMLSGTAPDIEKINCAVLGVEVFGGYNMYLPYDRKTSGTGNGWNMPRNSSSGHKHILSSKWLGAHTLQIPALGTETIYASKVYLGPDGSIPAAELREKGERAAYAKYVNAALRAGIAEGTTQFPYREPNEMLGIRESYRLNGLYNATQTDCETQLTQLGDRSILSSWHTELHSAGHNYKTIYRNLTGIPISTMFSPKFKNYINPSKGKGISHLAHSTFRLMRTCWLSGRLAAEIIKLCWQSTLNVQNVDIAAVNDNSGVTALFAELQSYITQRA